MTYTMINDWTGQCIALQHGNKIIWRTPKNPDEQTKVVIDRMPIVLNSGNVPPERAVHIMGLLVESSMILHTDKIILTPSLVEENPEARRIIDLRTKGIRHAGPLRHVHGFSDEEMLYVCEHCNSLISVDFPNDTALSLCNDFNYPVDINGKSYVEECND